MNPRSSDPLLRRAAEDRVPPSLVLLMVLQFAAGGALYPFIALYLADRGLDHSQTSTVFVAAAGMSSVLPFLWGWVADRFLAVDRLIALLHLGAAGVLLLLTRLDNYPALLGGFALYSGLQQPTTALVSALAYHNLSHPERSFGRLRLWGSVGWMLPSLPVYLWLAWKETRDLEFTLYLTAGIEFLIVLLAPLWPYTPPPARRARRARGGGGAASAGGGPRPGGQGPHQGGGGGTGRWERRGEGADNAGGRGGPGGPECRGEALDSPGGEGGLRGTGATPRGGGGDTGRPKRRGERLETTGGEGEARAAPLSPRGGGGAGRGGPLFQGEGRGDREGGGWDAGEGAGAGGAQGAAEGRAGRAEPGGAPDPGRRGSTDSPGGTSGPGAALEGSRPGGGTEGAAGGGRALDYRESLRRLASLPGFFPLLGGVFLVMASFAIMFYYSSPRLEEVGIPRRWIGLVHCLGILFEIPLFLLLPKVLARLGYRRTLLLGASAAFLRHVLYAFCADSRVLAVASALVAPAVVFFLITASLAVNAMAPRAVRATAQAIVSLVGSGMGSMTGLLATGRLAGGGNGLEAAFVFAALSALGGLVSLTGVRTAALDGGPPPGTGSRTLEGSGGET